MKCHLRPYRSGDFWVSTYKQQEEVLANREAAACRMMSHHDRNQPSKGYPLLHLLVFNCSTQQGQSNKFVKITRGGSLLLQIPSGIDI